MEASRAGESTAEILGKVEGRGRARAPIETAADDSEGRADDSRADGAEVIDLDEHREHPVARAQAGLAAMAIAWDAMELQLAGEGHRIGESCVDA